MPRTYAPKRKPLDPCPLELVFEMVGGKWKARIVDLLAQRPLGFGALRGELGRISQQVLSTQLQALERDGLVVRSAAAYTLSAKGRELVHALTPASDWGRSEMSRRGLHWRPPDSPTAPADLTE